eukprot:965077-Prymnesium_polylepis.1
MNARKLAHINGSGPGHYDTERARMHNALMLPGERLPHPNLPELNPRSQALYGADYFHAQVARGAAAAAPATAAPAATAPLAAAAPAVASPPAAAAPGRSRPGCSRSCCCSDPRADSRAASTHCSQQGRRRAAPADSGGPRPATDSYGHPAAAD